MDLKAHYAEVCDHGRDDKGKPLPIFNVHTHTLMKRGF